MVSGLFSTVDYEILQNISPQSDWALAEVATSDVPSASEEALWGAF
jgi:hypothetical protein